MKPLEEKMLISHAKRQLYSYLLGKDPDQLTPNEIELGYLLAKDPDIQQILNDFYKNKKQENEP